jgi:hypothetical protein
MASRVMSPLEIISKTSDPTFAEMMASCQRSVREMLYSRLGIKAKSNSLSLQLGQKRDEQVRRLHEKFKAADSKAEGDVCAELIRNWLYTKRPMLKAALDFLEVPNQDGLVETELDFFKDLPKAKGKALFEHISKQFGEEPAWIYLNFVEVPLN